jgi:hypothetical protein
MTGPAERFPARYQNRAQSRCAQDHHLQELTIDALGAISEPVLFVRQLHEHCQKVHQSAELVAPLADALLAEDYEKVRTLRGEATRIADEAGQMRLLLCDQIKDMHFRSASGYAFSQYLAH